MKCKGEKDKKKRYISERKKRKKKGRSTKPLMCIQNGPKRICDITVELLI